jgi:hypothetical protein
VPSVKVPFFQQRLRSRLLDHPYWSRRSYEAAFFCSAALTGALAVLLAVFVIQPRLVQRLHVAMGGAQPDVEKVVQPDTVPGKVVGVPTAVVLKAPDLSGLSDDAAAALAASNAGVPDGAVRIPEGMEDQELEIVKRLAAAALENGTIDARPVGTVRMREYELNNGQRMMVVDEIRPSPKAVKCVYY